jgi:hypothetical protein
MKLVFMNTILKYLLSLILLADLFVLLALIASSMFGFGFSVRIGRSNHFRELSRMELSTVLGITVIVGFVSLVLLKKLPPG